MTLVHEAFVGSGLTLNPEDVAPGRVAVLTPQGPKDLLLEPLAKACSARPESDWADQIDAFVHAVCEQLLIPTSSSTVSGEPALETPVDPARITREAEGAVASEQQPRSPRDDLRVQLWSSRGTSWLAKTTIPSDALSVPLAEGITAVLMMGEGVWNQLVTAGDLAALSITPAEAWKVAVDNGLKERFELKLVQLPNVSALVLLGNGTFISALASDVPRTCAAVGAPFNPELGTLVAMPNWHALVLLPLKPGLGRNALTELATLVQKLHNYADAVSPDIFWWRARQPLVRIDPEHPPLGLAV
ncbi:MAG: hypothetical protein IPK13_19400 [Deltaproteobacteria bacterium]|nr:hypothetical protein [Deltaproteobacteria bacterium]